MLKLKLMVKRMDLKIEKEIIAVANSGFVGARPQLLIPKNIAREFKLGEILEPTVVNKKTAIPNNIAIMSGIIRRMTLQEDKYTIQNTKQPLRTT